MIHGRNTVHNEVFGYEIRDLSCARRQEKVTLGSGVWRREWMFDAVVVVWLMNGEMETAAAARAVT